MCGVCTSLQSEITGRVRNLPKNRTLSPALCSFDGVLALLVYAFQRPEQKTRRYTPSRYSEGMALSPAERQRRSDLAKEMHQRGQLGRKRARPATSSIERPRSASDLALSLIAENRDEIRRQVKTVLKTGSPAQRSKMVELLIKTALSAERIDSGERKAEHEARSREELIAILSDKLTNGPVGGILRQQIGQGQTIESTAAELP
jgi:hypothetical protein